MTDSVLVVGDGAAATLVVVELLRTATAPLQVVWVGDGTPGHGVAYSTRYDWHRLNVPADTLSLAAADLDFPSWSAARGIDDEAMSARDAEFAPRWAFGAYLAETLRSVRAAVRDPVALRLETGRVVALDPSAGGVSATLADGRVLTADRAVYAPGPFSSATVPGADDRVRAHPALVADPWTGPPIADGSTRCVVLVGTGLTMADVALTVARRAPRASIVAVSRSGLLPRAHARVAGQPLDPVVVPAPDLTLDDVVTAVNKAVADAPQRWRDVVDGLRPVTQGLWRSLSPEDRRRFRVEHARRWEVHRHRMAPAVADEIARLRGSGRLEVRTAGVARIADAGDRLRVHLDPTDGGAAAVLADRVVSCTGAEEDVTAVDDPLVAALLRSGAARPHPSGLGFDTDDDGALSPGLHTLGATRRGALYETTSIPEIRDQAAALARHLLDRSSSLV